MISPNIKPNSGTQTNSAADMELQESQQGEIQGKLGRTLGADKDDRANRQRRQGLDKKSHRGSKKSIPRGAVKDHKFSEAPNWRNCAKQGTNNAETQRS
jgi:hypothetical protein